MNRELSQTPSRHLSSATLTGLVRHVSPARASGVLAIALLANVGPAAAHPVGAVRDRPALGVAAARTPAVVSDAQSTAPTVEPPADESVAVQRQEIVDFVRASYAPSAGGGASPSEALLPQGEALLALAELSDADVVRIHSALPLVHNWSIIQARMAAGAGRSAAVRNGQSPDERDDRVFSAQETADLEQFRTDLDGVFVTRQSWAGLASAGNPAYLERIDDARTLLRDATLEDLDDLQHALDWIPDWQRTLAPDLAGLLGPGGSAAQAVPKPGGDQTPAKVMEPQVTTEQCSDADYTRNTLPLIIAKAVLDATSKIEDYAAGFFTKDIKICFGVFLITVCVDFPNPVFMILKGLEFATERVIDGLDAAITTANIYQAMAHWIANVEHRSEFLTSAQGVLSSLISRHNELMVRTQQIDKANREAWKLQLQLAIEENLLEPLPSPPDIEENRISLFQLTDTVCFNPDELLPTPMPPLPTPDLATPADDIAPPPSLDALPTPMAPTTLADRREQCGIELVKRIVSEAIQLNRLAGNSIHDAESSFAAGNVHLAAGRYKEAYLRYRQAYQAAVQPDAEPRMLLSDTLGR